MATEFSELANLKDIIFIVLSFILLFRLVSKAPSIIESITKSQKQEKEILELKLNVKYIQKDISDMKQDIADLRRWQHDLQISIFNKDIRSGGI